MEREVCHDLIFRKWLFDPSSKQEVFIRIDRLPCGIRKLSCRRTAWWIFSTFTGHSIHRASYSLYRPCFWWSHQILQFYIITLITFCLLLCQRGSLEWWWYFYHINQVLSWETEVSWCHKWTQWMNEYWKPRFTLLDKTLITITGYWQQCHYRILPQRIYVYESYKEVILMAQTQ